MQVQKWLVSAVAAIALVAAVGDADAKRMGSSRSVGKQNSNVTKDSVAQPAIPSVTSPAASPASAPSAASAARASAPAAAAAPARRSWLGPIAGLAAGLGLAALASHLGFGEGFANIMMIVLLGMIALFAIRFFMARRAASAAGGLATAAAGNAMARTSNAFETVRPASSAVAPLQTESGPVASWQVPVGFDTDAFVRNARVHFTRMQGANDVGNLADLREFTSNELYAELAEDIRARGGKNQATEIVSLNAQLVHFEQSNGTETASVRFTGVIREDANGAADAIDEVWNMQRPSDLSRGWVVAGIQQLE
jgi:predicted lipid-binding transport protein (Tim44 family)